MRSLLLVAIIGLVCGCKLGSDQGSSSASSASPRPTRSPLDQVVQALQDAASGAVDSLPPEARDLKDKTVAEVEKMFQVEYLVIDYDSVLEASEMQRQLGLRGAEGWECFAVTPIGDKLRVTCKKRPKGVMRYLKNVPFL
jgi:hypothetical protein